MCAGFVVVFPNGLFAFFCFCFFLGGWGGGVIVSARRTLYLPTHTHTPTHPHTNPPILPPTCRPVLVLEQLHKNRYDEMKRADPKKLVTSPTVDCSLRPAIAGELQFTQSGRFVTHH